MGHKIGAMFGSGEPEEGTKSKVTLCKFFIGLSRHRQFLFIIRSKKVDSKEISSSEPKAVKASKRAIVCNVIII